MNILYSSALTALGVVGIGYVSRKTFKESLGTRVTLQGTIKVSMVIESFGELPRNHEIHSC